MPTETLAIWGWRIPFVMGLVVGIAGFVLRRHVVEAQRLGAVERTSVMGTLRDHGPLLARLADLSVFNAVGFYLLFV